MTKKSDARHMICSLCLLVLFLVSLLLNSCSKPQKDDADTRFDDLFEALSQYYDLQTVEEETTEPTEENVFVVVIPAGCGAEIFDSAAFLSRTLSKYVGYDVELVYDSDFYATPRHTQILVGATNRDESRKALKSLRIKDAIYTYDGGSLVIAAHDSALIKVMIERFAAFVESGEIKPSDMNKIKTFLQSGEYDVSKIKLDGFELCEYDIVYPKKNEQSEMSLALMLRDKIAEYSGYNLRVLSDSECSDSTRAICVGKTSLSSDDVKMPAENQAVVTKGMKNHVELLAADNGGIKLACDKFIDVIKESQRDGECDVEIDRESSVFYDSSELSVYIMRDDFVGADLDMYVAAVRGIGRCDAAVFDNLSSTVIRNLRNNLGSIINVDNNGFYYVGGSRMECVSSESISVDRGAALALVLKKPNDVREFVFIGAFSLSDGKAAKSRELLEALGTLCDKYSHLPMVVASEMNDELTDEFSQNHPNLSETENGSKVFYSVNRFELKSYSPSYIGLDLHGDVIRLNFYYK